MIYYFICFEMSYSVEDSPIQITKGDITMELKPGTAPCKAQLRWEVFKEIKKSFPDNVLSSSNFVILSFREITAVEYEWFNKHLII